MIARKTRLWLGLGAFVMVAHALGLAAASATTIAAQGTAQQVAQNTETPPSDCAEESACVSGTAGEEGEGAALQFEADIAQHFGPGAVAHAHIFKANHAGTIASGCLAVIRCDPYFRPRNADQTA